MRDIKSCDREFVQFLQVISLPCAWRNFASPHLSDSTPELSIALHIVSNNNTHSVSAVRPCGISRAGKGPSAPVFELGEHFVPSCWSSGTPTCSCGQLIHPSERRSVGYCGGVNSSCKAELAQGSGEPARRRLLLSHKHVPSLFRAALCQREPDLGNAVPPMKGQGRQSKLGHYREAQPNASV